jgi:glycosyltransferase involved in cell wall biosynthesis
MPDQRLRLALLPFQLIESKVEILQLTPGAGTMFCGNCLRDNALVAALRTMGHQVLMVPLYLPLTLDEVDQSAGTPVFFSGINVYLEQKSRWFRGAPRWLHTLLASRSLLRWAAIKAGNTRAENLGDLTLSMLQGESGNQSRELEELVQWLKTQPKPDVIFLSNAMLLGMARRLRRDLDRPVVCMLQGEDYFLDSLPQPQRSRCWESLAARAGDADLFIAPSRYFSDLMRGRLGLPAEKLRVIYNGINLDGYKAEHSTSRTGRSVLGYFARMCPEKGLDVLVEAFITLRKRRRIADLKLCVAGSLGPADEPFVNSLRQRLESAGLTAEAEFHSNVDRQTKLALLESFSVFSVPSRYGEAFGLYVIEALAAGAPVVQPQTAAFPELLEMTGGGVLYDPDRADALADAIEGLLRDPGRARDLGDRGKRAVFEQFNAEAMAGSFVEAIKSLDCCTTK